MKCETTPMSWVEIAPGIAEKRIWTANEEMGRDVSLVRLAAGASLPSAAGAAIEVLVLEGVWESAGDALEPRSYARVEGEITNRTAQGCLLFVRRGPADPGSDGSHVVPVTTQSWRPGHGNLKVQPLHAIGEESSALVHWPAGERFLPHQHWGGEEIFVLSGTFRDEHGAYPQHTWLLSPHLSGHHPYVEEETVIFVKTGHLVPVG